MSGVSAPEKMGRKPKIVRLIARNAGGPAWQVCELHERLADKFETRLIVGSLSDGEQDMSYLLSSETHVLRLAQMSRKISILADVAAFWKILRFFLMERPDIVHTHAAKAGALGRLAAWLAGVPIIVHTYHGHVFRDYFSGAKSRIFMSIERMLGRLSTRVIAISNSQLRDLSLEYRVALPEKFVVIQNGFELDRFSRPCRQDSRRMLGLSPQDFVVVWAGRMVPVKDPELLAQTVRRANEIQSNVRFLVLGEGTEMEEFERLTEGCENVQLLGWRRDMETIWAAADAALLTSRNEGTPTALIEAMASGHPFVSTNVGGVQDLAIGELTELPGGMGYKAANGFLASRTPEALVFCIQKLVNCPRIVQEMGAAGRAFVLETFTVQRLVDELTEFYQSLLKDKGIPATETSGKTGSRNAG